MPLGSCRNQRGSWERTQCGEKRARDRIQPVKASLRAHAQKSPELGLMLCCRHPSQKFLPIFQLLRIRGQHFHFALGPRTTCPVLLPTLSFAPRAGLQHGGDQVPTETETRGRMEEVPGASRLAEAEERVSEGRCIPGFFALDHSEDGRAFAPRRAVLPVEADAHPRAERLLFPDSSSTRTRPSSHTEDEAGSLMRG